MAPASRSDLDSPIRLIKRPPMRPPAPATTTLIMLVSCSPFLLFPTYRRLIRGTGGRERAPSPRAATWAAGAAHGATNKERHVCARRRDGEAATRLGGPRMGPANDSPRLISQSLVCSGPNPYARFRRQSRYRGHQPAEDMARPTAW